MFWLQLTSICYTNGRMKKRRWDSVNPVWQLWLKIAEHLWECTRIIFRNMSDVVRSCTFHCSEFVLNLSDWSHTSFIHTFLLVFIIHCSSCRWSAFFLFNQQVQRSGAAAVCRWPFTSELKTNKVQRKTNFSWVLICLSEGSRKPSWLVCCCCCLWYCLNMNALSPECTVFPPEPGRKGEAGPKWVRYLPEELLWFRIVEN